MIYIVLMIALLFVWLEYWPSDDPATVEECVESHEQLTGIGTNGVPTYNFVCDETRVKQCVRWQQRQTWAGKLYRTCEAYE